MEEYFEVWQLWALSGHFGHSWTLWTLIDIFGHSRHFWPESAQSSQTSKIFILNFFFGTPYTQVKLFISSWQVWSIDTPKSAANDDIWYSSYEYMTINNARSSKVFPIDPSPDWIMFWNYQITAMTSSTTSLGVWQGKEENYLLWEMVDRNNRGFIIAGWLDNGHMPPLQVLDSTLLSLKVQNRGKLYNRVQLFPIFASLICHNLLRSCSCFFLFYFHWPFVHIY